MLQKSQQFWFSNLKRITYAGNNKNNLQQLRFMMLVGLKKISFNLAL